VYVSEALRPESLVTALVPLDSEVIDVSVIFSGRSSDATALVILESVGDVLSATGLPSGDASDAEAVCSACPVLSNGTDGNAIVASALVVAVRDFTGAYVAADVDSCESMRPGLKLLLTVNSCDTTYDSLSAAEAPLSLRVAVAVMSSAAIGTWLTLQVGLIAGVDHAFVESLPVGVSLSSWAP
jgi:hypothetical protein